MSETLQFIILGALARWALSVAREDVRSSKTIGPH